MKTHYIYLYVNHRVEAVYQLDMPQFGEKNFRNSNVSLSAFRSNEMRRRFPDKGKPAPFSYGVITEEDYNMRAEQWRRLATAYGKQLPEPTEGQVSIDYDIYPINAHFLSVFDFYEHISYDHRKKKHLVIPAHG